MAVEERVQCQGTQNKDGKQYTWKTFCQSKLEVPENININLNWYGLWWRIPNKSLLFIPKDTQCWPCSTSLDYDAPSQWGDILKSIFLKVKLSTPCLFHSAVPTDWQVALRVCKEALKENLLGRDLFFFFSSPSLHLQQARWPGEWETRGTRLQRALEMAVSIKYHFQFPCFMIPGLLSTNNPPSAGPPTLSWGRLITLVASYKKDIYMKIRKQLLCLHGSESRKKAIPNLIFIQRRGEITISWRLIWVSFGGRAKMGGKDVCRLNKAGKLFLCNIDGCCLHLHNEDVSDCATEIALDTCVTCSAFRYFYPINKNPTHTE